MSVKYTPKRQFVLFYNGENWENYLKEVPAEHELPENTHLFKWEKDIKHYSIKHLYDKGNTA